MSFRLDTDALPERSRRESRSGYGGISRKTSGDLATLNLTVSRQVLNDIIICHLERNEVSRKFGREISLEYC